MDQREQRTLRNFAESVENGEMLKQAERARMLSEEFKRGAAIPTASSSDIKQLWAAHPRINADIPPDANVAIGLGVVAAYGVEAASDPVRFLPVQWRHMVMADLLERGILATYVHGGEPHEIVFRAAATIPLTKEDIVDITIPKILAKAAPEVATKALAHMRAQGYDPEKPNIDAKFLRWLEDKCKEPL